MRAFVLQDWVTIRGGTTVLSVVQNEASYLTLDAYQDVIFWLQVSEVTTSAGTITMNYETAPLKDETLFSAMAAVNVNAVTMTPPKINSVFMNQFPTTPLARFVRWHITTSGTTAAWDLTFRILVAGNQLWTSNGGNMGAGGWGGGGWGGGGNGWGNRPLGR